MDDLARKGISGLAQFIFALGILLFAPAWTFDFWQAWIYFAGVGGTNLPKRSSGNELELILGALADLVARKLRRDVLKQIESQAPFSTGALD